MLRIGGGYEPLELYLEKKHKEMVEKVFQMLEAKKIPIERLIYDLCIKYQADPEVIKAQKRKVVLRMKTKNAKKKAKTTKH